AMPGGDATIVVAAAGLAKRCEETRFRRIARDLGEIVPGTETLSGGGRSVEDRRHGRLHLFEEVDALAFAERHVGLLPIRSAAERAADPARLAEHVRGADL